jgi:predicted unusual protein kinase regulating ubiquinone biosynthesis (AarF/ABC1/UbiB family)
MVNKRPKSGTLTRGLRLGKLGLSLTGSYLGYQAQNLLFGENEQRQRRFHKDSSRKVRQELGSLKGAAMKLGQLLSLQTRSLPAEVTRELAGLQMQAPPMHPTLARAQFKASLGKYPEEVFRDFEVEPFAAASLGQVHRAVTRRGEKVAVKIQYPAIRTAIENDFRLLRSATLPARITGHMPQSILNEVQRGFLEETDYLHEAKNIEFFSQALAHVTYLTVPKVLRDTTTDRVLTMSFVDGEVAGTFLDRNSPAAVRDLIGARLVELFYHQLHHLRALHADHHPGNYLFQPDGRIGLVDFGCVKRISFDASALIRACTLRNWRRGDKEAKEVLALILGPQAPFARARKMLPTLEVMANTLFPAGNGSDLLVNFGKGELLKILGEALKRAVRDKVTNPEFAFVSRAELGLYSLLHSLNAKVNPTEIWRRVQASPTRAL